MQCQYFPEDYLNPLRLADLFAHPERPLELDIGCGEGTFLRGMAAHFPEVNFLGIERLQGRVRKTARDAKHDGLHNVRLLLIESSYVLEYLLPPACADRIHLLFPDPWPKKRHAKNRFLQPHILEALTRVLKPNGQFLFKTDHPPYAEEGKLALEESGLFQELPWDNAAFYPTTDFEAQWRAEGKEIFGTRWRSVGSTSPSS